jgi:hypothetical protein
MQVAELSITKGIPSVSKEQLMLVPSLAFLDVRATVLSEYCIEDTFLR